MTQRPLSPHLQVYRPQITSVLSITHRATGVFLAAGTLVVVYWLYALAAGPQAYAAALAVLGSLPLQLVLFGWTWAMFYHLANGIRHLFWDAGMGYELEDAARSGWMVIVASVVFTIIAWLMGPGLFGGAA